MNQQAALNEFPYFTDIEETFIRCRGANLFISPKDWQLIETWEKRGIPQHIAITAIEDVFRDRPTESRKISTLAFCSNAVEERFAAWSDSQVGASEEVFIESALEACAVCGKEICWELHRD